MAFVAQIISVRSEGAKHRVSFRFVDGATVIGPRVEDRPADEDHAAWVESIKPQAEPDYRAAILAALGEERFDALATALADEGVQVVKMGPATLPVTAAKTNPVDVKAAVGARVDAAIGEGEFAAITATLRAAGFAVAELEFEPEAVTL